MSFSNKFLYKKYFGLRKRERLKAILLSFLIFLSSLIILIGIYDSSLNGYTVMSSIESLIIILLIGGYILFPKYLSLNKIMYLVVTLLYTLVFLSLIIKGVDKNLTLFLLSTLSIFVFVFFGTVVGVRWTVGVLFILALIILNTYFKWYLSLNSVNFLFKIFIGYAAVSYLIFILEKERQAYEDGLADSLKERNILLKEIHHRTKNNMQVIMALLETQSFKVEDTQCKRILQSHVERLKSMALVHEHLYRDNNYEKVEVDQYIKEITEQYIRYTPYKISLEIEAFTSNMKTAMNLALIYNEALSNALEHAYKSEEENKEIYVSLKRIDKETCLLKVKDYGKGFDVNKSYNTMGMVLMEDLSRSLSKTHMEVINDKGTEIRVYCYLEDKE
jgi:two-component sensor histidine kinase